MFERRGGPVRAAALPSLPFLQASFCVLVANTRSVSWVGTPGETAGERRRRMRTAGLFLEEMFETVAADSGRAHAEHVCMFCRSRNPEDVGKPRSEVQMQLFPRVAELAGAPAGRSVEGWRKSRTDYLERVFDRVNERGWDVFVAVNTFRAVDSGDGRPQTGRTRAHIASVLRVQLDLDGPLADNAAAFERMREDVIDGIVPAPSFVLRSSPEKYQALWNVDGDDWTAGQAELYSHLLAARYGGDEVVTPATQVMRVPGFRNAKEEYRSDSGSPVVDEVELSRRLWPVRPRAKLDVDRFRPLEGVVGVDALRRGLEKWVAADRRLGVSAAKVGEAESRAAEMAHENEAWRLRLRAASARAGVVLPPRMRGTVPEAPDACFSAAWPGRAVGLPRGTVPESPAPAAVAERSQRSARAPGAVPDAGAPDRGASAPASPGGRFVNRRGVPVWVADKPTRAERLRQVGIAEGWIRPDQPAAAKADERKPSEYDKQDWGRVLSALENGAAPGEVVKALAGMRSTGHGAKSDPLGYARKTVKRAQDHLEERAAAGPEGDPPAGGVSPSGSEDWRVAALRRAGRAGAAAARPPKAPAPAAPAGASTPAAPAPAR